MDGRAWLRDDLALPVYLFIFGYISRDRDTTEREKPGEGRKSIRGPTDSLDSTKSRRLLFSESRSFVVARHDEIGRSPDRTHPLKTHCSEYGVTLL